MSQKKQGKYRFHDFEVDLAHRSLQRDGHTITIGSRTFDLLVFLILKPQRVVTDDELMDALWPDSEVEESNLSQHIFLLRKALTGAKSGDKLLISIPGRGYQFVPPVTEVRESETQPIAEPDSGFQTTPVESSHAESVQPVEPSRPAVKPEQSEPIAEQFPSASPPRFAIQPDSRRDNSDEDHEEEVRTPGFFAGFRHPGPWHVALLTALVAALVFGGLFFWRTRHRPVPESVGLVLADFDNTTGNAQFDPALKTALTIDLEQSPFLRIAIGEQVTGQLPQFKAAGSQTLTPAQAREACQRLHLQSAAYLTGSVRPLGPRYLITIRAFDCASGSSLATSRGIADSPDAAVTVLDKVAVDLRKQLGEQPATVSGFSRPLFADRAASLEALKSYADAQLLRQDGKLESALTLLQHAVEVDPQFALAFAELGGVYAELGQHDSAIAAITRAFELRSSVDEPHRLQIVATYNDQVTGDILASLHSYKDWSDEYPRSPVPLIALADRQNQIGKPALTLEPAQRALKQNPFDAYAYIVLARAQMSLGQFTAANDTCQLAIDHQLDGEQIHGFLLQIAFLHLDQPGIDAQIAWAKGKPAEAYMLLQQGLMNFAVGKAKAGEEAFTEAAAAYRQQGRNEAAGRILRAMPRIEADLGLTQIADTQLSHMAQDNETGQTSAPAESGTMLPGSPADIPVAWAHAGETSRAQALLKSELDTHPTSTLWQEDFALQIKAAIALNQQRPAEAVDDLKPAQPFDLRSFETPALRGRAYLAAKQPELAEAEFHKILDHPGIEPLSHNYTLARLGLARALAQQGKTSDAGFAYKVVLQIWNDADPALPRLQEAKAEYAKLIGLPVKPKAAASSRLPTKLAAKPSANRR